MNSQVFQGGPKTSQHIMADDDEGFERGSFKLKRTRLIGLLDEFINTSMTSNTKFCGEEKYSGSMASNTKYCGEDESGTNMSSNAQRCGEEKYSGSMTSNAQRCGEEKYSGSMASNTKCCGEEKYSGTNMSSNTKCCREVTNDTNMSSSKCCREGTESSISSSDGTKCNMSSTECCGEEKDILAGTNTSCCREAESGSNTSSTKCCREYTKCNMSSSDGTKCNMSSTECRGEDVSGTKISSREEKKRGILGNANISSSECCREEKDSGTSVSSKERGILGNANTPCCREGKDILGNANTPCREEGGVMGTPCREEKDTNTSCCGEKDRGILGVNVTGILNETGILENDTDRGILGNNTDRGILGTDTETVESNLVGCDLVANERDTLADTLNDLVGSEKGVRRGTEILSDNHTIQGQESDKLDSIEKLDSDLQYKFNNLKSEFNNNLKSKSTKNSDMLESDGIKSGANIESGIETIDTTGSDFKNDPEFRTGSNKTGSDSDIKSSGTESKLKSPEILESDISNIINKAPSYSSPADQSSDKNNTIDISNLKVEDLTIDDFNSYDNYTSSINHSNPIPTSKPVEGFNIKEKDETVSNRYQKEEDETVSNRYQKEQDISQSSNSNNTQVSISDSSNDSPASVSSPIVEAIVEVVPHDDADITYEPSRHVDYLAYKWDVSDIAKSWRYVIQKRNDVSNAARLENASWRTWAQRRGNLKTISPEVVNWSKDSDVTWLYGPILKDENNLEKECKDKDCKDKECTSQLSETATFAVAGDISIPKRSNKPKPILKKRTVEESMISHSNLLKLQLAANKVYQIQRDSYLKHQSYASKAPKDHAFNDYDAILAKLNKQYNSQNSTNSSATKLQKDSKNSSIIELQELLKGNKLSSTFFKKDEDTPLPSIMKSLKDPPLTKRHIHFNEEVQQCIAVDYIEDDFELDSDDFDADNDYPSLSQSIYNLNDLDLYINDNAEYDDYANDEYDDDNNDDDDDDDDDEGGFFLKVKSAAPPNLNIAHSKEPTEDTDSISTSNSKVYRTIQLLPSTSINYASSEEESDDDNPYTSSLSHNAENKGYDFYYDYNSVYPNDANVMKTDVVDVPENISIGSNIDYEMLDSANSINSSIHSQSPIYSPQILAQGEYKSSPLYSPSLSQSNLSSPSIIPVSPKLKQGIFNEDESLKKTLNLDISDSETDSDSDEGFSISTRSSSKDLAQAVFGGLTSHYPNGNTEPVNAPTSTINPRREDLSYESEGGLVKQPHSSSSLSDQFFGNNATTSMSENHVGSGLVKQGTSSSSLSDQFFGNNATTSMTENHVDSGLVKQGTSSSSLSDSFFGNAKKSGTSLSESFFGNAKKSGTSLSESFFGNAKKSGTSLSDSFNAKKSDTILTDSFKKDQKEDNSANSFATQKKSTVLVPHTTSANAFSGVKKNTFLFDDSDSEEEDITLRQGVSNSSYNSLSQVAKSVSPTPEAVSVVEQAKDLANHLLGRK